MSHRQPGYTSRRLNLVSLLEHKQVLKSILEIDWNFSSQSSTVLHDS